MHPLPRFWDSFLILETATYKALSGYHGMVDKRFTSGIISLRELSEMSPLGDSQRGYRAPGWLVVPVMMLLLSLTVSLATRTFRLKIPHRVTVESNAPQAMRQHMDRDAVRWTPPAPVLIALDAPSFYPYIAPAGPPLPVLLFDKSLYNRPPPSC